MLGLSVRQLPRLLGLTALLALAAPLLAAAGYDVTPAGGMHEVKSIAEAGEHFCEHLRIVRHLGQDDCNLRPQRR